MPNSLLSYIVKRLPLRFTARLYAMSGLKRLWHVLNKHQLVKDNITYADAHFRIEEQHFYFKFAGPFKMALKVADNGIESRTIRRVYHYAKFVDKGLIVDVGVNYGFLSTVWAKALPKFRIVGFEANPAIFSVCKAMAEHNRLSNLTLEHRAITRKGHLDNRPENEAVMHALNADFREVPRVALDEYFKNRVEPIVALKIDTDGHDFACLEGALDIIKQGYPMLVIELNQDSRIVQLLLELGYRVFDIDLKSLAQDDGTIVDLKLVDNVYAYHPQGPVSFDRMKWINSTDSTQKH